MEIVIKNLSKTYDNITALNGINLEIPSNTTVGLIGHNGSGKTTLLEILCGIKSFDEGEINLSLDYEYKENIGVILQDNAFYYDARVDELVELYASFYKSTVDLEALMDEVGITSFRKQFYRNLSGGMKQRVNLALALVNNPELLILDEPTTGLDPLARKEFWTLLKKMMNHATIIISSHYMDEIEENCDYLVFLKNGFVVEADYLDCILKRAQMKLSDYYIEVNQE
jgi:ABC-2 type transport system ATP-binding protein